jgi:hypothetical protein
MRKGWARIWPSLPTAPRERDPLEMSPDGQWLCYAPLEGPWSQVETRLIDDPSTPPETLAAGVRVPRIPMSWVTDRSNARRVSSVPIPPREPSRTPGGRR